MKDDLISREEAVDAVYEGIRQIGYEHNLSVRSIIQAIRDLPSAEPKHGKWIEMIEVNELGEPYQAGVYCSECGHTDCYEPNYCPDCGARMDKDE